MEDKDKYLTVTKAAEIKGCSRNTIYQLIKRNKINTYKFAGKQFVVKDDVFLQAQINRGIPFASLEERIILLEKKVTGLEEENKTLREENKTLGERVSRLEGKGRTTRVRKKN